MDLPKHKWPDTENGRGLLMFAQVMREMLTATTFESFRTYSLDTTARLVEALQVLQDIRRHRVPKIVFDPVVQELGWALPKDPAAMSLAGAEIAALFKFLKSEPNTSFDQIAAHIVLIRRRIGEKYKSEIEELILSGFNAPNERIMLRKASGFYCSHIINSGYARQYILDLINHHFYDRNIKRTGNLTLRRFFREFDGKKRKFVVQAAVTRDFGEYLRKLGLTIHKKSSMTREQVNALDTNPDPNRFSSVFEIEVDQFDPYGAMDFSHRLLSAQRAIAYLDPVGMQCKWGETMHVARKRAKAGAAITKLDFLTNRYRAPSNVSKKRAEDIGDYARAIFDNFDFRSTERMISSIRTAALARTSQNSENQIIALWSSVEVLISEPQESARIVHYADLICPCVALRHSRRQIWAVYRRLLVKYRKKFNQLIRQVPGFPELNAEAAFAELMFLPANENLRSELCELLANNPLALHRIWKLHNDYSDRKRAAQTLTDHFNRVRWQIHRIYRARNQLVHSGRMPSYLDSLILNLAEYYGGAIATIVHHARREADRSDVDQIVAEIGISYRMHKEKISPQKGDNAITREIISLIVDSPE